MTYHIDPRYNLVRTHALGVLTDEDIVGHKKRLAADPRFTPGMYELSDVRGVTDLRVTPEGIQALVEVDGSQSSKLQDYKLAIVAGQDLVFGLARTYGILAQRHVPNIGVFRDDREAAEWLGVTLIDW
jgi:hypothetical protein